MTSQPAAGQGSRSAAVGDLFAALEGLLISYQALPDGERERRWGCDAELITATVALHLNTARSQIAARSTPWVPPRATASRPAAPRAAPDPPAPPPTSPSTPADPTDGGPSG